MAPSLNLSDDERFALMKFRRNVSDCTKPHNDMYLLRWLRARNFDVEAAEKMLRDSLEWRKEWEVDTLQSWEPPEVIKQYYPSGLIGFDKEEAPVVLIPFSGLDMWGMLHSVSKQDFVRQTLKMVEHYVEIATEKANVHGLEASQVVAIIDMEDFNLRQYAWRPAGEVVLTLIQMYEANYPEVLKTCYIINAPKVFAIAFSVVKNFLNDYTIRKIQIFKSDPRKWQAVLLDQIDAEQLPLHYGGTMTDPDGNPKCHTKVHPGGKIPKSLYFGKAEKQNLMSPSESYTTISVRKGSKQRIPFINSEENSFLKWEFRSDGHDIKFGVVCTDMSGNDTVVVPIRRVNCHQADEIGVITCPEPATYTVVFDNSYSYLRNKKIHYMINVTPPIPTTTTKDSSKKAVSEAEK